MSPSQKNQAVATENVYVLFLFTSSCKMEAQKVMNMFYWLL